MIKYKEIMYHCNTKENLNSYLEDSEEDLEGLLEYYKYRIFVPTFTYSSAVAAIHNYYYEKLKYYYNSVKKRLNMTIVDSSASENVGGHQSASASKN